MHEAISLGNLKRALEGYRTDYRRDCWTTMAIAKRGSKGTKKNGSKTGILQGQPKQ
jgi:hypothetical protein